MPGVKMRLDTQGWQQFGRDLTAAMQRRLPDAKRRAFAVVGGKAQSLVMARYETAVLPQLRLPARYRGAFGMGLRITAAVGPKRSYLTISATGETANLTEEGRGPGNVDREAIIEWAQERLGLNWDDKGDRNQIRAIMRKISTQGTIGHHIFYYALAQGTPGGQALKRTIDEASKAMMDEVLGPWARGGSGSSPGRVR